MNMLLTGATGFLGKYFIQEFKDCELKTLARSNSDFNVDLFNPFSFPEDSNFDVVIHAAGRAHKVAKNKKESAQFLIKGKACVDNLLAALSALLTKPKFFVFISSVAVYGASSGENISESSPLLALDAYGKTKIAGEQAIYNWCSENNVICTILRPALIVGNPAVGNLKQMEEGVHNGSYVNIAGGKARKSMVLATDVAKAAKNLFLVGGTYNICASKAPSFIELSHAMAKIKGKAKPRNIPYFLAWILALFGASTNFINFDFKKLKKITSTLTFDNTKALENGNWRPDSVLDFYQ